MVVCIDISILFCYLKSTSGVALSCRGFYHKVTSNGFPIKTSKSELCPENLSFYKLLDFPDIGGWERKEFFEAIGTNNADRLKLLLQSGTNTETRAWGTTGLIYAAEYGKSACLKLLLEYKADPEAKDKEGWTALLRAARHGKVTCLRLLLEYKADTEVRTSYENTALHWAAMYHHSECLKLLLQSGADADAKNSMGSTVLLHVAINGQIDCIKLLLEKGVDIDAKNDFGYTPLLAAANHGHTSCLKLLLDRGAHVDLYIRKEYSQYSHLWPDSTL